MKSNISKSAFAVTLATIAPVVFALAACANSADVPEETTATEPVNPAPASTLPPSSSSAPSTPAAPKCAPSCKADSDCASTCPAVAGGVQCCDTKTNSCFASKTSSCPKPDVVTGDPPPAY